MSKCIYENTYWCGKGKHQALEITLFGLLPDYGEIKNADDNPALELYRQAGNCYYDLYNNGLCNLPEEFERIFGFDGSGELTPETVKGAERVMNKLILAAGKEQEGH